MSLETIPAPTRMAPLINAGVIPAIGADGRLFPIDKIEAHRSGVLHLAVSVFIFHGDRLLIQRRAPGKYHCAGLWANSCCTHPHWGESLAASAARRLREELGLVADLTPGAVIEYAAPVSRTMREHERVQIYFATVAGDQPAPAVTPNAAETDKTRWSSLDFLHHLNQRRPELLAPWFQIYLNRWADLGIRHS